MAGRIAAVLGIAIVALAWLNASQQQPTILAVLLEVQPTAVRILSATAVRGVIRDSGPESLVGIPPSEDDVLVEYVHRTSGGAARVLQTGVLHVPLLSIIDEPQPRRPHTEAPAPPPATKRVVVVALSDLPGASEMSFTRLTPVAGVPPEKWTRAPLGQSPLPAVRRR